jgi:hypothetical protein
VLRERADQRPVDRAGLAGVSQRLQLADREPAGALVELELSVVEVQVKRGANR